MTAIPPEPTTRENLLSLAKLDSRAVVQRATFWGDLTLAKSAVQCFGVASVASHGHGPVDIWDARASDLVAFCELTATWPQALMLRNGR